MDAKPVGKGIAFDELRSGMRPVGRHYHMISERRITHVISHIAR